MSKLLDFFKKGPGFAVASSVLGGIGGIVGASKQIRGAKKQIGRLQDQREQALERFGGIRDTVTSGYENYIERLKDLPKLEIDRSLADSALQRARDRMIGAGGGRVAGEEILREEARRTTANQIEAARAAVGDGAGLLGAISLAGMSEAGRMRQIDIQTQRQRERELLQAESALERGLITRAQFERQAELAEFGAESRRQRDLATGELSFAERQGQLGFQEMGIEKEYDQAISAQRAAINQAKASRIQSIFGMASGAAGAIGDFKRDQRIMERFAPGVQKNEGVDLSYGAKQALKLIDTPEPLPLPQLQLLPTIEQRSPMPNFNLSSQLPQPMYTPSLGFQRLTNQFNMFDLQPRSLLEVNSIPLDRQTVRDNFADYLNNPNTIFGRN